MNAKKLRSVILRRKQGMTPQKLDVESVLEQLAAIRTRIPFLEATPRPVEDGLTRASDGMPLQTVEDFEWAALEAALETLADDLAVGIAQKQAAMVEEALQFYYATEEMARDPEHADLIEHVEKMRAAYESDFGKPIPPKGKK
jgi:hypothetical protein